MNKVNIYYGMSGSLKSSCIEEEKKKSTEVTDVMKSGIKFWKGLEKGLLKEYLPEPTNLNYAMLHLTRLNDFIGSTNYSKLLIERGITDMLYYHNLYNSNSVNEENIRKLVELEKEIVNCKNLRKILLIQRDREFVEKVVFNEPTRKDHFVDWLDYENKQSHYIEFTLTHNEIDEVITIDNVKDFIENILKTKFRE